MRRIRQVVVVGASSAGAHAVEELRACGFDGAVSLVGSEPHLPYERPPLSRIESSDVRPAAALLHPPTWYAEQDVTVLTGKTARRLRLIDHTVALDDGTQLRYEGLVIATGSRPRQLPNADHHVAYLRSVDDAVALSDRLVGIGHVVVVGAGFLGLELAASVRALGHQVTVVEVAPAPLARVLGDEVGEWFGELHARQGVQIVCDAMVVGVEPAPDGDPGYVVHLQDGARMSADLVIGAVGAVPAVGWLRDSGLSLADGVLCDERLTTAVPDVVAAGDVARWYNPLFDETMRVEQWMNAVEQGRHAARTLLGADEAYAPVPYLWSDQFDAKMRFVGRSNGASEVDVVVATEHRLEAVYGRDGVQVGALCVNAAGHLAAHREAISLRRPYRVPA